MSKIGVIALVPDEWNGTCMPRHQVLRRLADRFEVVWIEPPRGWRHYWLGKGLFESRGGAERGHLPAGFTLYEPGRWLPEMYRPKGLAAWLRRRRVKAAERILRRKGCTRIVLYLWRYEFAWALDAVRADLTCYHIDDEYQFSTEDRPNPPEEVALLRRVDFVIVHSPKLMEKKGGINPDTISIPNGVDFDAYSSDVPEPDDLAPIPHPRMGYVGVVKTQLDFDLLLRLARRRPEWSFVLVGPRGYLGDKAASVDELARLPNVHMLGNRAVAELPSYTRHMDVCLMCYEVTSYTNYIYPLKLHEYLATGRPVVSAPIHSVLQFADVVRLASGAEEWEEALVRALEPSSQCPEAVEARQAVAARHDWNLLVRSIGEAFETRLGPR